VNTRENESSPALATVTYLQEMMPKYQKLGITNAQSSILEVVSDVLWTVGEQTASINILRELVTSGSMGITKRKKSTLQAQLVSFSHAVEC
jgi:hypothetical protein